MEDSDRVPLVIAMQPKEIKIRRFQSTDARSVSRLFRRCLLEVNRKEYPASVIDQMIRAFSPMGVVQRTKWLRCFVAVRGSRIVGTGGICINKIYSVFVSPHLHGQGIGRVIVNFLESAALRSGHKKILPGSSVNAEPFYRSLGYKRIKKYRDPLGGNVIEMVKSLGKKCSHKNFN